MIEEPAQQYIIIILISLYQITKLKNKTISIKTSILKISSYNISFSIQTIYI